MLLRANLLFLASTLLSQAYGSALAPVILPRATVCNGHEELCSRSYGNVSYVGAHDSYAFKLGVLAANQDQNVTQQLNDGIRLLQVQALNQGGTIQLCHSSCSLLNGGTLQDYLSIVGAWLDANPNEVLTLLIVNINNLPATAFDSVFRAVGLDTISYSPPSAILKEFEWPTLGSMIDDRKRLVTFLDNGADFTTIPYIIDEFTNIWETKFDVTDPTFDCLVNRSKGDSSTEMFLINHFLDTIVLGQATPDIAKLNVTNAFSGPGSLGAQVSTCLATQGRPPNFMLVDFYEFGNGSVFEVAANINGVPYSPATPISTPAPTSASVTSTPLNAASFLDHNQRFACVVSVMAVMIGMLIVL
jgi:hypothetical protein